MHPYTSFFAILCNILIKFSFISHFARVLNPADDFFALQSRSLWGIEVSPNKADICISRFAAHPPSPFLQQSRNQFFVVAMVYQEVLYRQTCTLSVFKQKSDFCEKVVLRASEERWLEKYLVFLVWRWSMVSTLLISWRNMALLSLDSSEMSREGWPCEEVVLMRWLLLRILCWSLIGCLERIRFYNPVGTNTKIVTILISYLHPFWIYFQIG